MERITWGRMQNPMRGVLHGTAALAAAAGLAFLTMKAWGRPELVAGVMLFGVALVAMFSVSALYHSMPWTERWKSRMQRIDHSLIFVVVAATFTPVAISALDGGTRATALTVVWAIGLTGIILKVAMPRVRTGLSIGLQTAMGWGALVWLPWILDRHGWGAVALILAGGASYTLGTVVFATRRPRLFPRIFSHHEVFHVLVIAGAAFHFSAIARFVTG